MLPVEIYADYDKSEKLTRLHENLFTQVRLDYCGTELLHALIHHFICSAVGTDKRVDVTHILKLCEEYLSE
jgi:hypothetical protein